MAPIIISFVPSLAKEIKYFESFKKSWRPHSLYFEKRMDIKICSKQIVTVMGIAQSTRCSQISNHRDTGVWMIFCKSADSNGKHYLSLTGLNTCQDFTSCKTQFTLFHVLFLCFSEAHSVSIGTSVHISATVKQEQLSEQNPMAKYKSLYVWQHVALWQCNIRNLCQSKHNSI